MGLLDQFSGMSDDQTQGLLAAAAQMMQQSGPSLRPTSLGQIIGGGLGAYQEGSYAARKRKLDEEQAAQMAQLRGLQIKDATGSLQDHDTARAEAERFRQFMMPAAGQQDASPAPAMPQQPMASAMPGGSMSPKVGGPDWIQSYQASQPQAGAQAMPQAAPQQQQTQQAGPAFGSYEYLMAQAERTMKAGFPTQAKELVKQALEVRPKFANEPRTVMGADGRPTLVQMADDGTVRPIQGGYGAASELHFGDSGGALVGMDKYSGKVLASTGKTVTPGESLQSQDQRAARAQSERHWRAEQAAKEAGPDGTLPDETVQMMAQQYRAGDTSVMQNLGRGAQGAQNIIKLRNEIAKQTRDGGQGGADLAAKNAEYFGTKAGQRTAGTRIANVEMAASEAESLIPLAQQASAQVARSGLLPFGKMNVMFDNQTNDPKLRQFAAANNALVNVYARAISPSGVPTVADKEHAREMIGTAMDHQSYMAVTQQMQKEITAARAAPKTVRNAFNSEVTGREPSQPQAASKTVTLSDITATAKASGKSTAEVTKALKDRGYTIGGM